MTRATDTPEAYAFRKEETRANPFLFDETSTDEFIEFSEKLREKDQGEKLGFFPRGGPAKRLEEMGLTGTYDPKSGERLENPLGCLLYTSPSPRDGLLSRMPSSA